MPLLRILILSALSALVSRTPWQGGLAEIRGRVVQLGSGEAVVGATVKLSPLDRPANSSEQPPIQETDAKGQFVFSAMQPGRYEVTAEKNTYLPAIYGQIRPGSGGPGVSIRVAPGQRIANVVVQLARGAVIAGSISDARGEPALSMVRLWRWDWVLGERLLRNWDQRVADDRGAFRFWNLRPGKYLVSAEPISSTGNPLKPLPAAIFYPGTPNAGEAVGVDVDYGEEKTGTDIRLQPAFLAAVTGSFSAGESQSFATIKIAITDPSGLSPPRVQYTLSAQAGTFGFQNLAPGQYHVMLATTLPSTGSEPGFWAMTDVSIGTSDLASVVLNLQRGSTLSGRMRFGSSASGLTKTAVTLRALDPGRRPLALNPHGLVEADGTFTVTGIMPGRYALSAVRLPDGLVIQSVKQSGRDVYDLPIEIAASENLREFEVLLTDRRSSIGGTLFDATGQPISDYLVCVFPADEKYWSLGTPRIRTVRPANDGQYIFRDLPPGLYRVAALTDAEQDEWFAPPFLKRILPASQPIAIGEGEAKTVDVRLR